jgi:purine-nucleoside phosphorylase
MVSQPDLPLRNRVRDAAQQLLAQFRQKPRIAMLLGTGHASVSARLEGKVLLHRQNLPGGLLLGEESHLIGGTLEGVPVVVGDPPLAPYEGYGALDVTFPVRVLQAMGVEVLVLTAGRGQPLASDRTGHIASSRTTSTSPACTR